MNQHLLQVRGFWFFPPFRFLLFTIILFLLLAEPVISVDELFGTCVPERCDDGKGPDISYPFWIPGKHPSHCGYPGFQLTCDNRQQPILKLLAVEYIIQDINYEGQSFSVVDKRLVDNAYCPHPPFTLTFNHSVFHVVESNHNLLFFYNCTEEPELPQYQPIPCISNETHHSFARLNFTGSLMNSSNLPKKCGSYVSVPVMMDSKPQESYLVWLRRGFLLGWTAPSCSKCLESGGQCGYLEKENDFGCFCRDRPHRVLCGLAVDKPKMKKLIGGDKSRRKILIGVTIGVGVLILTCSFVYIISLVTKLPSDNFIFFWKKKTYDTLKVEEFLENYGSLVPKRYRYSELKGVTKSFKEKLGQGGYASVFKGKLNDGRLVAVKVLNNSKGGNGEEFINEVASIGRTYHVNVVTLLGFCFEGSKRALVYEFMSKGSLEKFIFSNKVGGKHILDCQRLFQIAVGIARGLEYLHRGCSTRIVHFDIKPHNILLDDDFCPKISDFGLAKLCPQQQSTLSMLDARGTIGYTAPEVFCRNIGGVSHKSDVYSYGMMVLEMIGGRKNIDAKVEKTSEIYFPHWVYKHIELKESLGFLGFCNEAEEDIGRKMVLVGLWCIQTDPTNRPSITKVVEMLEGSLGSLEMPPKPYLSSPSRSCSWTT